MPRGPTTKCPFCRKSLSFAYVKVPRVGRIENTWDLYYCRKCGTVIHRGDV